MVLLKHCLQKWGCIHSDNNRKILVNLFITLKATYVGITPVSGKKLRLHMLMTWRIDVDRLGSIGAAKLRCQRRKTFGLNLNLVLNVQLWRAETKHCSSGSATSNLHTALIQSRMLVWQHLAKVLNRVYRNGQLLRIFKWNIVGLCIYSFIESKWKVSYRLFACL